MSDVAIKVENLSKKYRIGKARSGSLRDTLAMQWSNLFSPGSSEEDFWALKDVSFEVKHGEVLGVIGRNGAGKSTLLKILSRITEPTTGRVELNGRVASLLEVGTGFHPELTGRENIFLNGSLLGMTRKEIKSKFDEIIDFSGVEQFIDTPVKKYSSGMYVRLAFAVAAHLESEILLVDEVLAVGDLEFQRKCLGKMDEVTKVGKALIFVSHNMGVLKKLCKNGLLLDKGETKFISKIDESLKFYLEKILSGDVNKHFNSINNNEDKGTIQLKKLMIRTSEKRNTSSLFFGEPFCILLSIFCPQQIINLSFVIGIDTADGIRVFTSISDEANITFNIHKGSSIIAAKFNNLILVPGKYKLYVSFRLGTISFLNSYPDVFFFEVNSIPYKNTVPYRNNWGLIRVNPSWELIKSHVN